MIYLKEANLEDVQKEYDFITNTPAEENGFTNDNSGCGFEEFKNEILPSFIAWSRGEKLPEGWVPCTELFIWDDDEIVGLLRLRHYLNDFLREYHGHIGYGIKKECRGKGYAKEALRLAVEKAWEIIPEDQVYMSVHKDNPASLHVQLANGAYIDREDDECYYTRISKK